MSDLAGDDFEAMRSSIVRTRGPVALGNEIQRVRTVFKYAYDEGLIVQPVRYGAGFKRPSNKVLRLNRAKKGPKLFEAADILKLIAAVLAQSAFVFDEIHAFDDRLFGALLRFLAICLACPYF